VVAVVVTRQRLEGVSKVALEGGNPQLLEEIVVAA